MTDRGATAAPDWDRAYREHGPDLLRYLRRLTHDPEEATELLQETFAKALRASHVPPETELRPWLYRIASNAAVDALRRAQRARLLRLWPDRTADKSLETTVAESDQIRRALRSLPPEQAVVLVLRTHEGLGRSEIANVLHINEETVKTRLLRGRRNFAAAYARMERGLKA